MPSSFTTVSIGYVREDGDFAILATLNNNDSHFSDYDFTILVVNTQKAIRDSSELVAHGIIDRSEIILRYAQDAPDYVEVK